MDLASGCSGVKRHKPFTFSPPRGVCCPPQQRTTFDEILASGRFGLIRDTSTRVKIADYYAFGLTKDERIEERETQYSNLSYRFVPRSEEFALATDLSPAHVEALVARVFSSPIPDHILGEMNFTRFLNEQFTVWQDRCVDLIEELERYRDTIT